MKQPSARIREALTVFQIGATGFELVSRYSLPRCPFRSPRLYFEVVFARSGPTTPKDAQPGRASDFQGASPTWLMSASHDGRDQSGRGAPPLDRNGDPDPCLMALQWNETKHETALEKRFRTETRIDNGATALSKRSELALISRSCRCNAQMFPVDYAQRLRHWCHTTTHF